MPIRLRAKPAASQRDMSPVSFRNDYDLPEINPDDSFKQLVKKLSLYFVDVIELPSTFEQLRTTEAGRCLRVLVDHLNQTCTNPAIVNALLALKWHYIADTEHRGLSEARSNACEIVAWRFLTRLSEREAVDYCLYEIPDVEDDEEPQDTNGHHDEESSETSPLLTRWKSNSLSRRSGPAPAGSTAKRTQLLSSLSRLTMVTDDGATGPDPTDSFRNLNALEIAAIANAKRFLSQHVVQKIVNGIWNGDIIFWDSLSVHSTKHPRFYNPRTADPFSRLRVPKYLKIWEVFFFAVFLGLYYSVLVTRDVERLTPVEIALYFWIAAFFYDEVSEWLDAGSIFYAADIWNLFDMIMISIGFTFAIMRVIGITQGNPSLSEIAFDVLSLEALFMIPRICSILSLSPYWGTLIPCLKEMGKDFVKFMVLVVIVYLGFLTTFSLVGRETFSLSRMAWILTKIFFGSSFVGFEVMNQIDPYFGPPLMIIFVTLTSILLTGSLTGMLSNSFSRVITHAKEEYLYVYSIYVLEASTSNRLTHFYPPFNLIAFFIFRPLRLIFASHERFRACRIILLKATHAPIVAIIRLYELVRNKVVADEFAGFKGPRESNHTATGRRPHARTVSSYARTGASSPKRGSLMVPDLQREDDMDAPSAVEVQISELNHKIDQLTSAILAMQQQQQQQSASRTRTDTSDDPSL